MGPEEKAGLFRADFQTSCCKGLLLWRLQHLGGGVMKLLSIIFDRFFQKSRIACRHNNRQQSKYNL
jgi:hypothetical protein